MDNVTHTLIGIAIGHSFNHFRGRVPPSPSRTGHRLATATILAAAIASNIPDVDFVLHGILADAKLAYLVHHRGFTHTLLALPALAALSGLLALVAARVSLRRRDGWREVAWPAVVGVLLHIAADFCNEYGVHPFFPFSNRWFYGDFIFILEPAFWLALLPLAFTQSRTRAGWLVWGAFELVLYYLIWTNGLATPAMRIGLSLWGMVFAVWQWRRPGLLPAWVGVGLGLLVFLGASWHIRQSVFQELADRRPDERVLQLASSPAPGNPFQWRLILATVDRMGEYRVRVGALNLFPSVVLPAGFPGPGYETTAPLKESSLQSTAQIHWLGEFQRPLAELRMLTQKYCRLRALLRFTRAPFWMEVPDGQGGGLIAGDLRYDRERGLGFTEFHFHAGEVCLPSEPPWLSPITY